MTRRRHRPAPERSASDEHALPDAEICRRLESGDAAAAEIVYERVVNVVDAVLFRLLGANDHEREDLAQQAMERIIGTIVSGRYMRDCSLPSWATLITQHLAIASRNFDEFSHEIRKHPNALLLAPKADKVEGEDQ